MRSATVICQQLSCVIEEQVLDPNKHDRKTFTSRVIELDEYLQHFAAQQS